MAESAFQMQNQLQFNLGIPLAASNLAVRYHKPNPIVVERAAGIPTGPRQAEPVPSSSRSDIMEDRMALAVRLAQRDLKKQKETASHIPPRNRTPSPKQMRSKVTKGGTRIVYTREAQERAARLQAKRANTSYLKAREQGWNAGTSTARTQTPPRDKQGQLNLPATTNSPPTRDTDRYPVPRSAPSDDPGQEVERLQREMEGYLQQIQVIEQRAMKEDPVELTAAPKTRRRDGYLSDEEDPTRKALRQEEQATRAARQIYNLRQQVRTLQEHVTRGQGRKIKHTKKSQIMLRLAAAHRGAVRAIQSFVNQQLPEQDLRKGLPAGFGELALLIRQLALISTQIRTEKDTKPAHEDLIKMLDRVDELNKAWCEEIAARTKAESEIESQQRRRKSPLGRQTEQIQQTRGRQPSVQQRVAGKENRPKGLLKKQYNRPGSGVQKAQRPRKVTPERQRVLQAGLEALIGANMAGRQGASGMAWDITADESAVSEPADRSLILPKPLQHKRERAQKSVALAVPESHFTDPTLASSLKSVNPEDKAVSHREPWRPGGSTSQSPQRKSKPRDRSRSQERARSRDRSRSVDRYRSQRRTQDRSRSHSPRIPRSCVVQDMDEELIQELFPQGVDGLGRRPRSHSPRSPTVRSRSPRQRSHSPPRYRQPTSYDLKSGLRKLERGAEDESMVRERQHELAEISRRGMFEDQADIEGETVAEMLLNDLMAEAADDLTMLEQDDRVRKQARKLQNNPTLENMYQRLEQMELEQEDIRRRWGSFKFEEPTRSRPPRNIERPLGPVAMEITRRGPSQSHRVQSGRAYDKEHDEPIIFTKSAPVAKFERKVEPQEDDEAGIDEYDDYRLRISHKTRLKVPDSLVREVHSNLEKYQQHLRKTSHHKQGWFDPWKFVEEIADQVLDECLKEIDSELDEIGENIVHQVCKSEFAIPPSKPPPEEPDYDVDYETDRVDREPTPSARSPGVVPEPFSTQMFFEPVNIQREVSIAAPRRREPESDLESGAKHVMSNGVDMSERTHRSVEKTVTTVPKKEVSFSQEISYEREAIFDAADLDTASKIDEYEDQEEEFEDDEEDELGELSSIDSDEYTTDET